MERTILITLLTLSIALAGCTGGTGDPEIYGESTGGTRTEGIIVQKGSSTVLPLAEIWAEEFSQARGIQFTVAGGGSGAGATGLCKKELDLADMSREMTESETAQCQANGVEPAEWEIAFDGISVIVSQQNDFVEDLSVEQLAHIFRQEDHATSWNQIDPDFPDRPIHLCYPDEDSGTYEYFNEVILDKGAPREGDGVQQSHDDNVLVRCIEDNRDAIGYFGFAYLQENQDRLRALSVDGVSPTFETISDGTYQPLGRPIYIYTDGIPTGILADYMGYVYHPEGGQRLIEDVGYVALDEETRSTMRARLDG